jgi:hypothetical protein
MSLSPRPRQGPICTSLRHVTGRWAARVTKGTSYWPKAVPRQGEPTWTVRVAIGHSPAGQVRRRFRVARCSSVKLYLMSSHG